MPWGTIKFFNVTKGFGFITDVRDHVYTRSGRREEKIAGDVFIHISKVLNGGFNPDSLRPGVRVEFLEHQGRKGPEVHYLAKIDECSRSKKSTAARSAFLPSSM